LGLPRMPDQRRAVLPAAEHMRGQQLLWCLVAGAGLNEMLEANDVLGELAEHHIGAVGAQLLVGRLDRPQAVLVGVAQEDLAWGRRCPRPVTPRRASAWRRRPQPQVHERLAHTVAEAEVLDAVPFPLEFPE